MPFHITNHFILSIHNHQALESALCSPPSSPATQETRRWRLSCSLTQFSVSPSPKPWASSASWLPSWCSLPSKKIPFKNIKKQISRSSHSQSASYVTFPLNHSCLISSNFLLIVFLCGFRKSLPQVLVLEQCSVHSSLATPETHHSNNNCSHTLSWDSPCPKLWDFSVLWWLSCCCSLSKFILRYKLSSITKRSFEPSRRKWRKIIIFKFKSPSETANKVPPTSKAIIMI